MKAELFLHRIYSFLSKNIAFSYKLISPFQLFSHRFLRRNQDSSFFDNEMYRINDVSTSKLAFPF